MGPFQLCPSHNPSPWTPGRYHGLNLKMNAYAEECVRIMPTAVFMADTCVALSHMRSQHWNSVQLQNQIVIVVKLGNPGSRGAQVDGMFIVKQGALRFSSSRNIFLFTHIYSPDTSIPLRRPLIPLTANLEYVLLEDCPHYLLRR